MIGLMAAAAFVSAATHGQSYGDWLLARELGRHQQLEYAAIDLANPSDGHSQAGSRSAGVSPVVLPLADALGNRIGTVTFVGRGGNSDDAKIAADISRHVYSASGLSEPDPFVPGAVRSRRGQDLIERELRREPSLVTIAFHVALPGRDNRIIASNFGRIGKLADTDDQKVIATSRTVQEVTNSGKRLAVELPLRDQSRRTVGALSTSFLTGRGGQKAAYQSALRVQHDLSHSIPQLESLAR